MNKFTKSLIGLMLGSTLCAGGFVQEKLNYHKLNSLLTESSRFSGDSARDEARKPVETDRFIYKYRKK